MIRERRTKYNKERKQSQFFIDRSGKVRRYKGPLAKEIISMHYEISKGLYPELDYPDDYLMECGWIMVGSSVYHSPISHKKPTKSQIKKMEELDLFKSLTFKYTKKGETQSYYVSYEKYGILCED